jgi:hypothetical protein
MTDPKNHGNNPYFSQRNIPLGVLILQSSFATFGYILILNHLRNNPSILEHLKSIVPPEPTQEKYSDCLTVIETVIEKLPAPSDIPDTNITDLLPAIQNTDIMAILGTPLYVHPDRPHPHHVDMTFRDLSENNNANLIGAVLVLGKAIADAIFRSSEASSAITTPSPDEKARLHKVMPDNFGPPPKL